MVKDRVLQALAPVHAQLHRTARPSAAVFVRADAKYRVIDTPSCSAR